MVPLSLSTAWRIERLRTMRGNGPCGSGQPARDRQEPRVSDHAVIGAHAPLRHVPAPAEDLEGLHVEEPLRRKGQHQLLYLSSRRQVRAQDGAGLEGFAELAERGPGL